jgi:hypothetical protein
MNMEALLMHSASSDKHYFSSCSAWRIRLSGDSSSLNTDVYRYVIVRKFLFLFFLPLSLWIRLSGLFFFKINSEIINLIDSCQDSLDGGSARCKAAAYT